MLLTNGSSLLSFRLKHRERIEYLIIRTGIQKSGEITVPFASVGTVVKFVFGWPSFSPSQAKNQKKLIMAVVDLGQHHRPAYRRTVLVEVCDLLGTCP